MRLDPRKGFFKEPVGDFLDVMHEFVVATLESEVSIRARNQRTRRRRRGTPHESNKLHTSISVSFLSDVSILL